VAKRWIPDVMLQSPQSVDALSWFTRPFLPVTFAVALGIGGAASIIAGGFDDLTPVFRALAVLCMVLACLSIHRRPGPRLLPFQPRHAIVPLALSYLGTVISAVAVAPTLDDLTHWWAPLGVAVVIAALAPFNSAVLIAAFGALGTVVCCVTAMFAFGESPWPVVTTIVIVAVVPLQGTVAAALFSAFLVERVSRWAALPIRGSLAPNPALGFAGWRSDSAELRLLSDRVMPFIEQIADDGFINTRDRTVAAELAREVRDALIKTVDQTWLDTLAEGHRLRVVDPDSRAGRITLAQRGAIRALLFAVLGSPALVPDTLAIEVRGGDDGDVAVALSMRLDLPEGERLMLLAPYYLTLQATVDDLEWDDQDQLSMRFRIPAPKNGDA